MAIVKSVDNRFYNVADQLLEPWRIPAERVSELLGGVVAVADEPAGGPTASFLEAQLYGAEEGTGTAPPREGGPDEGPGAPEVVRCWHNHHWHNWHNWHNCY